MNSLFNLLNGNNILSQFEQFKRTFTGDPKKQIENMLNMGQITQEQFNELAQKATELRKMLPR